MRRLRILAVVPIAALLVAGQAFAQDQQGNGTPAADEENVASRVIPASDCTAQPVSVDALVAAASKKPTQEELTVSLATPLGTPVDPQVKGQVIDAVRGMLACFNANDRPRAAASMTETAMRRFFGGGLVDDAAIQKFRDSLGQKQEPRKESESIRLLAVTDVSTTKSGKIEAFVIISEPLLPPRGPETLLMVFVPAPSGNGLLVDNFLDFSQVQPAAEGTPAATPAAGA